MLFFLPSSNFAYHGEEYSLKVPMDEPAFFFGRNFAKMQKNRNKWNILSQNFRFSGKNLQIFFFKFENISPHLDSGFSLVTFLKPVFLKYLLPRRL
jgi:hypothetical protein